MERYARQTMLPEIGTAGQERLARSSALVVGIGGLGAPVAAYLAASGIGRLGLADADTVSVSNLQRQILYDSSEVGLPKTECARKRLCGLAGGNAAIEIHPCGLTPENADAIVQAYDVVVDCTDNFATRLLIDDVCARLGKPWVHGSLDGFSGIVTVFNHKQGKRYRDLYPDAEELAAKPSRTIGTIGPVPGIIGSWQAAETMKVLMGIGDCLDGKLLAIDVLDCNITRCEF